MGELRANAWPRGMLVRSFGWRRHRGGRLRTAQFLHVTRHSGHFSRHLLGKTAKPVEAFSDALNLGGPFFAVPRGRADDRRLVKGQHETVSVSIEPDKNSSKLHTLASAYRRAVSCGFTACGD